MRFEQSIEIAPGCVITATDAVCAMSGSVRPWYAIITGPHEEWSMDRQFLPKVRVGDDMRTRHYRWDASACPEVALYQYGKWGDRNGLVLRVADLVVPVLRDEAINLVECQRIMDASPQEFLAYLVEKGTPELADAAHQHPLYVGPSNAGGAGDGGDAVPQLELHPASPTTARPGTPIEEEPF